MPLSKSVGARIKRREDPSLIRGLGQYVDDVKLPEMLHVAILRSPHAHARIKSIDTAAAGQHPGVVAVVTGAELRDQIGTIPTTADNPTLRIPKHFVLAVDKVCYVGEGVAAVVTESRYTARDAIDLIQVEYDPLPAVTDPEKALAPDSPVIHSEWPDNLAFHWEQTQGEVEKAFKQADKVVKQKLVHQRLAPIAIETRGVVARYLSTEKELTVWSSTQIPHLLKTHLAKMLQLPEEQMRVIAPDVGGGFGSKLNVYAEEGLLAWMAMKLGRPVKWVEERRENIQATIHGRGQVGEVEAAVKKDGTILGLRYKVVADIGAYHQLFTPAIPPFTGLMLSGCYKIPAIGIEVRAAFTNKMSTDAYRGAGRPEATYVIERLMDRIAQELDIDAVKVRRKNFPQPQEFPFKTATGLAYDSGNYPAALDKALKLAGYQAAEKVREKARDLASHLLEVDADDLVFSDGRFAVKGVPRRALTIQQIAGQAAKTLPKGSAASLSAESTFEPANFTFPFGTHVCVVEVEPETGNVEIKKYVAVDDCGKVINPLLVDGQVQGGIAQGLGQALYEEVVYDKNGQLLTGSLMDYALPRAANLPRFQLARTETPTPVNPLGVKGIGEAGTIGSTPAVVGAVVDALAPFGVTHIDMPLTPQKIWRLCREKKPAMA